MFFDWKFVCHFLKIKHKILPAYTEIKHENSCNEENKEPKVIFSGTIQWSFTLRRSALIWIQIQDHDLLSVCNCIFFKTVLVKIETIHHLLLRKIHQWQLVDKSLGSKLNLYNYY